MLRINLLPSPQRKTSSSSRKPLLLVLLLVCALAAGVFQTHSWLNSKIGHLRQVKQSKTKVKKRLYQQVHEIKSVKEQLRDMRTRVSIIRDIRAKQSLPVRYLDQIVSQVPEDKMWFESLTMDNKGRIQLKGVALDNQVFARYLQNIRHSEYITDIALQQTQRKKVRGLGLVGFRCSISASSPATENGGAHGS